VKESLRRLFWTSLEGSVGAYGMVRLVEALERGHRLSALVEALESDDVSTVVAALGWDHRDLPGRARQAPLSRPTPGLARVVERFARSTHPAVLHWLACTLLAAERPELLGHPDLGALGRQAVFDARTATGDLAAGSAPMETDEGRAQEVPAEERTVEEGDAPGAAGRRVGRGRRTGGVDTVGPPRRSDEDAPADAPAVVAASQIDIREPHARRPGAASERTPTAVEPTLPVSTDIDHHHAARQSPWGEATPFAGLLLLVQVLRLIGVAEAVAEDPDRLVRDWPRALLFLIARRLGVPAGDPTLRALSHRGAEPPTVAPLDRVVTARLIRAMRAFLRGQVGVRPRELVAMPGRVAATRTHVDAFFPLAQADLRVRIAGVDVNPGWVPWLGRIVSYHYLETIEGDS
jgi:hypothetical protein